MTIRRFLAVAAAVLATLVAAAPAHADPGGGGGGDGNGSYYAYVKSLVHIKGSGYRGKPSVQVDYDPPHCWYQPQYTYDEMFDWVQRVYFAWHHQGPEDQAGASAWQKETLAKIREHEGEPGKIFWFLTDDGTDAGWNCYVSTDPFWIYVGAQPPAALGDKIIDPMDLALIARANLTLPKPRFRLNPPARNGVNRSYVGLPTWVSTPRVQQLDVTAYVEGTNLSATITATPVRVDISVSDPGAQVRDGRATCPRFSQGANPDAGCTVRFSHASIGGPYRITVTQVWDIATNVGGVNLAPDPALMSTSQTVVVDEIQSTVTK
ncbi:hypothetical protein [Microbispora sp. ATCC PTA-5024]|uniref:hypothetical protein n=1 Tax=Microbispora sp. ATCC PTA-5024 TaxID=316330 RepID=UPI0003DC7334|nr:hypothetical protein [Microbispora sp. ATCC PTA-5024]ETK33333.1 hypothetical protein MPTA5024_25070 [Microbispora sp. ATCC PTA-5024]